MRKLLHPIVSVDKYTWLATFCPTELNSVAQKRKIWVGYMALSHNSEDTTGHHKMNNWLLAVYFSSEFLIHSQTFRWTLKCYIFFFFGNKFLWWGQDSTCLILTDPGRHSDKSIVKIFSWLGFCDLFSNYFFITVTNWYVEYKVSMIKAISLPLQWKSLECALWSHLLNHQIFITGSYFEIQDQVFLI